MICTSKAPPVVQNAYKPTVLQRWFRAVFKNLMPAGTYDKYEDVYVPSDEYDTHAETQLQEHIHQLRLQNDQQARQISELQANVRSEVEKGMKI